MLTLFACPKPFDDPLIRTIQENAISSWTSIQPRPNILVFGDEEGVEAVCHRYGAVHVPGVARNDCGTPFLNWIFDRAQVLSPHRWLCYINSDIIISRQLLDVIAAADKLHHPTLIVGSRTALDLSDPMDFLQLASWQRLTELCDLNGSLRSHATEYFCFSRGLFDDMPSFAVGRPGFDNWLIWRAKARGAAVIDATPHVLAVHQNHRSRKDTALLYRRAESRENIRLAGWWPCSFTPADCQLVFRDGALRSRVWASRLNRLHAVANQARACVRASLRNAIRRSASS